MGAPPHWLVRTGWKCDLLGNHTKTGLERSVEGLVHTLDVLAGDHQLGALQQRQGGQVLGDGRLGLADDLLAFRLVNGGQLLVDQLRDAGFS